MSEKIYSFVQHSTKLHCIFSIMEPILLNPDVNINVNENSHFTQIIKKIPIYTEKVPARFILYIAT